jgi:hypothetical protein
MRIADDGDTFIALHVELDRSQPRYRVDSPPRTGEFRYSRGRPEEGARRRQLGRDRLRRELLLISFMPRGPPREQLQRAGWLPCGGPHCGGTGFSWQRPSCGQPRRGCIGQLSRLGKCRVLARRFGGRRRPRGEPLRRSGGGHAVGAQERRPCGTAPRTTGRRCAVDSLSDLVGEHPIFLDPNGAARRSSVWATLWDHSSAVSDWHNHPVDSGASSNSASNSAQRSTGRCSRSSRYNARPHLRTPAHRCWPQAVRWRWSPSCTGSDDAGRHGRSP